MSIVLNSKNGKNIRVKNIFWCYILYLGEEYNWKPMDTQKPEDMNIG